MIDQHDGEEQVAVNSNREDAARRHLEVESGEDHDLAIADGEIARFDDRALIIRRHEREP